MPFRRRHFKIYLLNETVLVSIKISLKFIPKGPINNIPALVQIMAWRRPGDKPLSEPMMVSLLTHICVTRPQWVNDLGCDSRETGGICSIISDATHKRRRSFAHHWWGHSCWCHEWIPQWPPVTGGFLSQKVSNSELSCVFFIIINKLLNSWDAMALMWRHYVTCSLVPPEVMIIKKKTVENF